MIFRAKLILIFSTIIIVSCSGGGSGGDVSNTTIPEVEPPVIGNAPDPTAVYQPSHAAFIVQDKVHGISSGVILSDGRLIARGFIDPSKRTGLFSTGPDFSQFTALTPKPVRYSEFAIASNRSVYLDNGVLYSDDSVASLQLSATDVVEFFWLSPDQTKILYIANVSESRQVDATTGKVTFKVSNELFVVDVLGGNRAQINVTAANSYILYEGLDNRDAAHRLRPQFLPDMSRVIYVVVNTASNGGSANTTELHSVRLDGSDRIILNANLSNRALSAKNEFTYTFTSNSSHVIYGVRVDAVMELYSITPDGLANTKISGNLVTGGSVYSGRSNFTVMPSPDNSYVVYLADADTDGTNELYRVALDGSNLIKLSNGTNVFTKAPLFTADGQTIVYVAGGVYAVAATGGVATKLTSALTNPRVVFKPVLTNDQTAVVFVANDNDITLPKYRLYLSKLDGSATIDLSGAMIDAGEVHIFAGYGPVFMLDPTANRLVFRADALVNSDYALFAVNLDGSNRIQITPDRLYSRYSSSRMFGFFGNKLYFSYDSNFWAFTELYSYDFSNNNVANLNNQWPKFISEDTQRFSVKQSSNGVVQAFYSEKAAFRDAAIIIINGASSCRIELPENTKTASGSANFFLESNGNNLYYTLYDANSTAPWRFYSAATSDCSTILVNQGITENLNRFKVSPNGNYVAYSGVDTGTAGLYLSLPDGSNVIKLNASRATGGIKNINNGGFTFSADSSRVVYWGDQDVLGQIELYSVTLDGLVTNKINASLGVGGKVFNNPYYFTPQLSPDNQWIIYKAKQDTVTWELYKSKLDGTANTKLTDTLVDVNVYTGNRNGSVKITADSSKVVYLVSLAGELTDIYFANLNGAPNPIKLNSNFVGVERFSVSQDNELILTPNSNSVVYMARDDVSLPIELYASTLNASATTNKLNSALVANTDVINFSVTADGSKVAYHTREFETGIVKLYVSNIDGSSKKFLVTPTAVKRLNSLSHPRLTADNRVVFRAVLNEVDGIYIMSLTGGDARLVFAINDSHNIEEVFISNNSEITVLGDLRLANVLEVFKFAI